MSPGNAVAVITTTLGRVEDEFAWAVVTERTVGNTTVELAAITLVLVITVSPLRAKLVATALCVKTTDALLGTCGVWTGEGAHLGIDVHRWVE